MRDAQAAQAAGATHVQVCERCVITPSARDFLRQNGIELVIGPGAVVAAASSSAANPVQPTRRPANLRLFSTPEAEAIKLEMCAVGRSCGTVPMWTQRRQYLLSHRAQRVLCTPTLFSKLDLTPADLCLVDLDGVQIAEPSRAPARYSCIWRSTRLCGSEGSSALPSAACHRIRHHRRVPPNGIIPSSRS